MKQHHDIFHTGKRGESLRAMIAAKLPVLPGFIVSAEVFRSFIDHNDIDRLLEESSTANSDERALKQRASQIRKQILQGEFPDDVVRQILTMYLRMGSPRVMLFPSVFLDEKDHPLFAQSEQYFFGYEGEANLFLGIKEVWSHFFDPKPFLYRCARQKSHSSIPFAISVQRQPHFKVSGTIHTDDPTARTKQTSLIKAVFGEGGMVGDLTGADYYWVRRGSGELYKASYDTQRKMLVFSQGEEEEKQVSESVRTRHKVSASILPSLGKLAHAVQQHYFYPQVITFGYDGTKAYIVEVHPMPSAASATLSPTPSSTQKTVPPAEQTSSPAHPILLGVTHQLTPAGHLPPITSVNGYFAVRTEMILRQVPPRTQAHLIEHGLTLSLRHTQAKRGILFLYPDDELPHAECDQALKLFHARAATVPLALCASAKTPLAYAQWSAGWKSHTLHRASTLSHLSMLTRAAQAFDLSGYLPVGIDGFVVDIDQIDRGLHGGEINEREIEQSPALRQILQLILGFCHENGLHCICMSTRLPTRAMLEELTSITPITWVTDAHLYPRVHALSTDT